MYIQYVSNVILRNSGGADRFFVDSSGNTYADGNITAYYSDERLKDKVGKIENALDKVSQIETFYFKENELAKSFGHDIDKVQVGVSAQSVKKVLPEIVDLAPFDTNAETKESKSGEDYMTVDYAKLTPLLIEAIKELKEELEELRGV
jgi:DNA-directed RNA polymerase specialized sigma subunit